MSDSSNIGRKKITFNSSGDFKKKIDFSSLNISNNGKLGSFNNNNQFTKHTFEFQKNTNNVNNKIDSLSNSATSNVQNTGSIGNQGVINKFSNGQFRKPNISFQQKDNNDGVKGCSTQTSSNQNINKDNFVKSPRNQFKPTTFSTNKQYSAESRNEFKNQKSFTEREKNLNGGNWNNSSSSNFKQGNQDFGFNRYKKPFGNTSFSNNTAGSNKFNFVKKDNKVKVKLNIDKNKNEKENVYRKTANTGGNIDKYSINSMIKGLSSGIEIDTEIDDVLGNVISVKPAGINSANSFQHERKVRTSNGNTFNKVNFNQQIIRNIEIHDNQITIGSLATQMAMSVKDLIKLLESNGIDVDKSNRNVENTIIDGDTAQLIAESIGNNIVRKNENDVENEFIKNISGKRKDIRPRAPIVTIMGHVDHGKTTLLDTIRKASVASGEAGGITQHIGAYRTKVGDKYITFLDTPGHAAFTQMRMRGAQATDIAVIVIAADDGIMPQTIEAINHAKVANVPIIVAINKIDKPEANIENAKQMLLQHEVIPEELGGDVMVVPISAKNGKNIDKLLEAILLQAEMLELKAYYDGGVDGIVIESKLDKKRGALVSVIVKNGILSQGDFLVAGEQYGKIKGMFDENGKMLKTAEPSVPVEILGLNSTPDAGEIFYAVKNEKDAKKMIEYRQERAKREAQQSKSGMSVEDAFARIKSGDNDKKYVSIIIKADTKGSLEAIVNTLNKIENNEVELKIVHTGVGTVSENDVLLAGTCGGMVFTFNTQKCDKKVLDEAEKKNVEIRDYKIIYELFDDVKDILSGKLKPVVKKNVLGHCEVKAIFEISKVGKIAGCLVKDGIISRGANVAVMRNGEIVIETKCGSLKHGKENVKDIQNGLECGVGIDNIDEVNVGDILEFYTIKEEKKII